MADQDDLTQPILWPFPCSITPFEKNQTSVIVKNSNTAATRCAMSTAINLVIVDLTVIFWSNRRKAYKSQKKIQHKGPQHLLLQWKSPPYQLGLAGIGSLVAAGPLSCNGRGWVKPTT